MSSSVISTRDFPVTRILRTGFLVALAAFALAACSGSGPATEANPITTPPNQPTYSGPPPATADVQAFRINLWENIKATNRCGQCHTVGGQTPMFARQDDVNQAYDAANTVVNLTDPSSSRMVQKVGGGHNCWLSSPSACADILTTWITNWAGAAAGGGTQIKLLPPPDKSVASSRNFPPTAPPEYAAVHDLLTVYCSRCHQSNATTPQSPFFAASDIEESYQAAKTKINLDDASLSRLVVRLRDEHHNCWDDCATNAATMQAAIQGMINAIAPTQVDPKLVISKALSLYDGTVASGGNRFDGNAIAKWEFKTGSGNQAFDTSGVEPALNLTLSGDVTWVGGWGINVKTGGKAQGTTGASKKLHDLISATGEYSIEAWVAPANVMQEDANIVSYSGGNMARNFTLAQQQYQLDFANRSSTTDANGSPDLVTDADDEDLQATLQHIVVTFDPINGRRIYVNGVDTGDRDAAGNASLSDWDDTFAFVLGNEVSGNRQFTGVYRLVVIHNRVLTQAQIQQNFAAGVGERYFLLFNVTDLVDVPQSYIMFEVSQYDSYAYLFNKPAFISLDPNATPGASIPLKAMRIGENGIELPVGQAYRTLDTAISDSLYTPATGQPLSSIGTIVSLEKGPQNDLFFLSFDLLGTHTNVRTEPAPLQPGNPPDVPRPSDVGVKTFDEINASMAAITGVSPNVASVKATYDTVKQQLPAVENIQAFLASHQVAIAQMAISYCSALVDDTTKRSQFWGLDPVSVNLNTSASQVINPLVDKVMGLNLPSQPSPATVRTELGNLISGKLCASGCSGATRNAVVVKATCAAALGSAVTTVQ
ncbi:MAG TPA: LamG domain-containing protein [Steroidobacteraceae bacterium]|nr:LamG domain-containing protein [Steroidobacteraceae bacterium]